MVVNQNYYLWEDKVISDMLANFHHTLSAHTSQNDAAQSYIINMITGSIGLGKTRLGIQFCEKI